MELVCRYSNKEHFKPAFTNLLHKLHWHVGPDLIETTDPALFTVAAEDGQIPQFTRLVILEVGTINGGAGKLYRVRLARKEERTNGCIIAGPMRLEIQPFM